MNWICDPGHAWLKVKIKDLFKSGVSEKISPYSYLLGSYAYLEEDCDAPLYLQAVGKLGRNIRHTHTNRDSRIRSYYCFSYKLAWELYNLDFEKRCGHYVHR